MKEPVYYEELQEMEKAAVDLPTVIGPLAVTLDSYPFNAADRQQRPIFLSEYGYMEEEYIVSGYANVYV